jgi:hypothetical protein
MKFIASLFILVSFLTFASKAQKKASLQETIMSMDSLLFNAFNNCDTLKAQAMFTKDLGFYQDNGGLIRYEENNAAMRYRCTQDYKVRRELVAGSTEVYPIKDFGAVQLGSHKFYYTPKGGKEALDGTFRFMHLWKNDNGNWKITRVISFDH